MIKGAQNKRTHLPKSSGKNVSLSHYESYDSLTTKDIIDKFWILGTY